MLTRRYVCNEYGRAKTNCTRAFNYLPVDGKLYGFYVGKHDHPPHIVGRPSLHRPSPSLPSGCGFRTSSSLTPSVST